MSKKTEFGVPYAIESLYECVTRRDGSRVWRSVDRETDLPIVTGGCRFLHMGHSTASLDAERFSSSTRIRLRQTFQVEHER